MEKIRCRVTKHDWYPNFCFILSQESTGDLIKKSCQATIMIIANECIS